MEHATALAASLVPAAARCADVDTARAQPLLCALACRSWAADHPAHFYRLHPRLEANALYLAVYAPLVALFIALLLVRDGVFSAWSVRSVVCLGGGTGCTSQVPLRH
jgi:hypothetical protein